MLFSSIDILRADGTVAAGQFVGVKGKKIEYIGADRPGEDYGRVYDGRGKLLAPGFINSHCHVPMTLLRGYGEGLPLDRWLNERVFPFEDQLDGEAVYYGSLLGIAEMFASGITGFSEMYYFCEDIVRAVLESGISCNMSRSITAFDNTTLVGQHYYREAKELYKRYHGAAEGRLMVDMNIHAEYTNNGPVVAKLTEYAQLNGCRMQIHLSETRKEHEECIGRYGKTPAEFFLEQGLFEVPTTAAHCVHVTESDMEILREKKVTVAHCPTSNMKLGSGIAPVTAMRKKGLNVALGTDGVASNNNFDMIKEMRFAALLQNGVGGDPRLVSPAEVLHMATLAGARGQGREDTGEIAVGKMADLVVVDCASVNMIPCYDRSVNLVYSTKATDILMTLCRGTVVYEDGAYPGLDMERVRTQVVRSLDKISK